MGWTPQRCGIRNSRESLSNSLRRGMITLCVCARMQTVSRANFVASLFISHPCLHNTFACTGHNQDLENVIHIHTGRIYLWFYLMSDASPSLSFRQIGGHCSWACETHVYSPFRPHTQLYFKTILTMRAIPTTPIHERSHRTSLNTACFRLLCVL